MASSRIKRYTHPMKQLLSIPTFQGRSTSSAAPSSTDSTSESGSATSRRPALLPQLLAPTTQLSAWLLSLLTRAFAAGYSYPIRTFWRSTSLLHHQSLRCWCVRSMPAQSSKICLSTVPATHWYPRALEMQPKSLPLITPPASSRGPFAVS